MYQSAVSRAVLTGRTLFADSLSPRTYNPRTRRKFSAELLVLNRVRSRGSCILFEIAGFCWLVNWRILPAGNACSNRVFCSRFCSGNEILLDFCPDFCSLKNWIGAMLELLFWNTTDYEGTLFIMQRYLMRARFS